MAFYSVGAVFLYVVGPAVGFWIVFGASISLSRTPWREWHNGLIKSPSDPPVLVSLAIWTLFHALMGFAFIDGIDSVPFFPGIFVIAICWLWFVIQLGLSYIWTATFFGAKKIAAACIIGVIHWISVAVTVYFYCCFNAFMVVTSALYLVWVTFQQYLTWYIFKQHRLLPKVIFISSPL